MPISIAAQTIRCRAASPALCPAVRGKPILSAHRPLPSMTQATCFGIAPCRFGPILRLLKDSNGPRSFLTGPRGPMLAPRLIAQLDAPDPAVMQPCSSDGARERRPNAQSDRRSFRPFLRRKRSRPRHRMLGSMLPINGDAPAHPNHRPQTV